MQTTLNLLDAALTKHPAPYWHERLGLSRNALHSARARGQLSPALAAALAAELGENVPRWTLLAVIENERSAPLQRKLASVLRAIA
jgi:hypothetical protein